LKDQNQPKAPGLLGDCTSANSPERKRRPRKGTLARLKRDGLDGIRRGTALARVVAQDRADLVAHLGGDPSVTELRMVDAVQVLDLLITAGVAKLRARGPIAKDGNLRPLAREVAALIEHHRD